MLHIAISDCNPARSVTDGAGLSNAIPAAIVIACVYIPINLTLASAATRLERRSRHRDIIAPVAIGTEPELQRGGTVKTVTGQG